MTETEALAAIAARIERPSPDMKVGDAEYRLTQDVSAILARVGSNEAGARHLARIAALAEVLAAYRDGLQDSRAFHATLDAILALMWPARVGSGAVPPQDIDRDALRRTLDAHQPETGHREAYCSCGEPIGDWGWRWYDHLTDVILAGVRPEGSA